MRCHLFYPDNWMIDHPKMTLAWQAGFLSFFVMYEHYTTLKTNHKHCMSRAYCSIQSQQLTSQSAYLCRICLGLHCRPFQHKQTPLPVHLDYSFFHCPSQQLDAARGCYCLGSLVYATEPPWLHNELDHIWKCHSLLTDLKITSLFSVTL